MSLKVRNTRACRHCRTPLLPNTKNSSFLSRLLETTGRTSSARYLQRFCAERQGIQKKIEETPAVKGSCYGCGATLQFSTLGAPGYVECEKYKQKQHHRQLDQLLCRRCRELSHGNMIPMVLDAWSKTNRPGDKLLVTPEHLRQQLADIREKRALIVLLVDLLDVSGSLLANVRDLTGANPVVIIGTKADLLPKGTQQSEIVAWLADLATAKKVLAIHTCIVSSKMGEGVPEAAAFIRKNRLGRDVYIVGAANVGKSAFSRALVKEMSNMMSRQYDPAAANTSRRLPVASAMPGTTLQMIPLRAFHTGGLLYDTPGLHLHHRIPHKLAPEELKALHPRGRLKPYVPPTPADLMPSTLSPSSSREPPASATYMWGGLARIDVLGAPQSCIMTFYTPTSWPVTAVPLLKTTTGPVSDVKNLGGGSVQAMRGLHVVKKATITARGPLAPLADIAISGMPGWATISSSGRGAVQLQIWAPKGVEAFVRPPLPCPNPAVLTEALSEG